MYAFDTNLKEFHAMMLYMSCTIDDGDMDIAQIVEAMVVLTNWYRMHMEGDLMSVMRTGHPAYIASVANQVEYVEFHFMKIRNSLRKSGLLEEQCIMDAFEPFGQIGDTLLIFNTENE
ncbi:hypothetical protein [Heterosigma akashiwo virus 01]|uniref:Uncharacterized protein n=1 Tax=Heterosigma akashiwo virus 01 TaxID=97195 RepID=A0A1C9C5C3_HAV01|nr:hypothetical protein D1R72_gp152 [Heterosigma akashiwo virus 01]AOM63483.1 hypothetical protein [Heterosigma akashiwo virus 01]